MHKWGADCAVLKYIKRKDGEGWSVKNRIPFRIGCCDCGLVHNLVLHVRGRRKGFVIGIAAERNDRATAAKRRYIALNMKLEGQSKEQK